MSDYWDAVSRVALGLPGSAEPPQRSIFEDEGVVDSADGLDVVELDAESAPKLLPAPGRTGQPTPAFPGPATIATSNAGPIETASILSVPVVPSSDPAEVRPVEQPRNAQADRSAETREKTTPTSPREFATRVEVYRIETQERTLRLVDSRPLQIGSGDDTASSPPAEPPMMLTQVPAQQAKPTESSPVAVAPSPIVIAEPVAAPPADRAVTAPEPPLVIEIGRIEIRIESGTPTPGPPKRRVTQPVHSLDDFLRRSGAGQ